MVSLTYRDTPRYPSYRLLTSRELETDSAARDAIVVPGRRRDALGVVLPPWYPEPISYQTQLE